MSESVVTPSYNVADTDLSGLMSFYQKNVLMQLEKVTPAKIISYDRDTNRAVVQILNYSITSTGEKIARKPLIDIPVFCFGGGDFVLSFPIKENDVGFLSASDGDISVFKKLLEVFAPATYQKHKYKDSVFYPMILNGFTVNDDDKESVLLSSLDGKTRISLNDGYIVLNGENITDKSTTKTTETTSMSITAVSLNITAATSHTGSFNNTGTLSATTLQDTTAASDTFTTYDGKTVTVLNGIIREIA